MMPTASMLTLTSEGQDKYIRGPHSDWTIMSFHTEQAPVLLN